MTVMRERKTPQRMCIACREMKDKKALLRIVKNANGQIALDFTGKKNGRGAYICDQSTCIQKCVKAKLLHKTFSCDVPSAVYEDIVKDFTDGKRQD